MKTCRTITERTSRLRKLQSRLRSPSGAPRLAGKLCRNGVRLLLFIVCRQQSKSLTENFPCDLRESWCELRMYICSTGDDFLSERTAIMNALLPELQVRCASRRIRISAVDCWSSSGLRPSFSRNLCLFVPVSDRATQSHSFPESLENPDLFARLREIDRCAIFIAFCGRRFGDPFSEDMFPPKLRLLSPHDLFLQELVESVNEAAFSNTKAVPLVSMCEFDNTFLSQLCVTWFSRFLFMGSDTAWSPGSPPKSSTGFFSDQ
jgi:hypothetical protein